MAKNVAIGIQSFSKLIENDCFYVDKTDFIREWWDSKDEVTLIARPPAFWKNIEYEHDRAVLFPGICSKRRPF